MKDFADDRTVLYYLSSIQKYVFKIVYETTVKEYDLHPGQIPILFLLEYKPGAIQREIATSINVEPGTVAVMLKRMEKKGLIFRNVDENDRRISRVYLTKKAEDILKQIKDFTRQMEDIILSGLSDSERITLMELLTKIRKHLSTFYGEKDGEKGGSEC